MTKDEWLSSTEPEEMLDWIQERGKLSERKARLIAVACCRRIWPLLTDERSRRAVEVAERYADGLAISKEMVRAAGQSSDLCWELDSDFDEITDGRVAYHGAWAAWGSTWEDATHAVGHVLSASVWHAAGTDYGPDAYLADDAERTAQADLLRDLVHPFRSSPTSPLLLTDDIRSLASSIYERSSFERLPELAALLEDAGCRDAELINHLRGNDPHGRGCWAVDLLLGKC